MAPLAASERQWLPLRRRRSCLACQPGRPWRRKRPARRRGTTCSGIVSPRARGMPRATARRAAVPLPKPRPAEAPSAERDKPDEGAAGVSPERQARPAGRARTAAHATAIGLPAGADRRHRDCAQHPRHPGRRRLRGRGSGAAGGDRAAGQAAGFGEAGGDPALPDGVSAGRRGSAAISRRWRSASAAPSPISTISTRSNAAAATASSAPSSPSTAAPMRSTFAPSSSPTAARSR